MPTAVKERTFPLKVILIGVAFPWLINPLRAVIIPAVAVIPVPTLRVVDETIPAVISVVAPIPKFVDSFAIAVSVV